MNIYIITVFGSYNHGSLLQAKALQKVLSCYGNASLYKNDSRKWSIIKTSLKRTKFILSRNHKFMWGIKYFVYELIEAIKIKIEWKKIKKTKHISNDGIAVLGSDEIWNLKRKECQYGFFWGIGINCELIAYATSINNASKDDLLKFPQMLKQLEKIKNISVRDSYTKKIIGSLSSVPIHEVLDPTFLVTPNRDRFVNSKPYIAVYSFEDQITEEERLEIIKYAKCNNLELIAAGQNVPWCNKCVHSKNGSPFYIFENATIVITSTFHGTVFAINFKKRFISFAHNNLKIINLLEELNLSQRSPKCKEDIIFLCGQPIDYEKVGNYLDTKKDNSLNYLNKIFEE